MGPIPIDPAMLRFVQDPVSRGPTTLIPCPTDQTRLVAIFGRPAHEFFCPQCRRSYTVTLTLTVVKD